jgi:hypothetical protein
MAYREPGGGQGIRTTMDLQCGVIRSVGRTGLAWVYMAPRENLHISGRALALRWLNSHFREELGLYERL